MAQSKRKWRADLLRQRDALLAAATQTIEENLHLADGDVCTLIHLKRGIEAMQKTPMWVGAINVLERGQRLLACGEDGSGRGGNTATKPTSVKQEDLSTSC